MPCGILTTFLLCLLPGVLVSRVEGGGNFTGLVEALDRLGERMVDR